MSYGFDDFDIPSNRPAPPEHHAPQWDGAAPKRTGGQYQNHKVYAGKAALHVEPDETRAGVATIRIEAAPAKSPRVYDWKSKVTIQVTQSELPLIAATLLGFIQEVSFTAHGEGKDKGFSITRQPERGGLFVRVFKTGTAMAIPVPATDVTYLLAMVLSQISKNGFGVHPALLPGIIKAAASLYKPPERA
ncbi:hypothetical protein [Thioalkalivibrio thiocyanodenitrificans]|uniref:hypothetical protein n=1 Tax=Thioalkalivibrio thiocyanodenitrificans TaxID=243063 RepID=UPI0003720F60|nr:hypothetical protein [Thioalkalivibrio thiocyanodenitrificans]